MFLLALYFSVACVDYASLKDADQDGFTFDAGDCDDDNNTVYPGATELPDDGIDNNCNGSVDETQRTDMTDFDYDGYSPAENDCNDDDAAIHPSATEVPNGIDDDCDGGVDEDTRTTDDDHDGFTEDAFDCDDGNAGMFPGNIEACDGLDNDCSGTADDIDMDGDGYTAETCGGDDCNDDDEATYPRLGVCTDGRLADDVLGALDSAGSAEVILSLPHNAMGDLPLGDPLREASISAQQDAAIAAAGAGNFEVTRRYTNVNAIEGVLTVDGAIRLGTDPSITAAALPVPTEVTDAEGDAIIGSARLRTSGVTGAGVTMAIIDTGFDFLHPDIAGRAFSGYDFVNDDDDATDDQGHGTAVAGIAGSDGATTGIVGVAPSIQMVALKVFDATGHGNSADVLAAFDWVATNHAAYGITVVNYSGGETGSSYRSDCTGTDLTDTITELAAAGVIVAVAAGNDANSGGISMPACATDALAVGAAYDAAQSYSVTYTVCGPETPAALAIPCYSNSAPPLDILAPSYYAETLGMGGGTYTEVFAMGFGGTSAATPYVAGAVALLQSADPTASVSAIRTLLAASPTRITDPRNGLSFPLLDASSAASELPTIDADSDGYSAPWAGGDDCDDADPEVNPGATEVCNGVDDDCNGDADSDASDRTTWYLDADGDGFGVPSATTPSCAEPAGYVISSTDCNDTNATVYPGAREECDGLDNDCNGTIDEDGAIFEWHPDADGDGFGDMDTTLEACAAPPGYFEDASDCNDADATIEPYAYEYCDGVDNDCNGATDDGAACPCEQEAYAGEAYLFCTANADWSTAEAYCETYGYHLVTLNESAEYAWVATLADAHAGSTSWWIGLDDLSVEGVYTWAADGSTPTYPSGTVPTAYTSWPWLAGEPNNRGGGENCIEMDYNNSFAWNDDACYKGNFFVCEGGDE